MAPILSRGTLKMNTKTEFAERVPGLRETRKEVVPPTAVLRARPVKNPRTYEEMLEHAKNRFPKTLAYLAR
jgi:hypothetical protein